jgi:hypothetical protein
VYRSTNDGVTWGSAVTTTTSNANIGHLDVFQSGDVLYVVWDTATYASGMDTLIDIEYQEFNMATNTWSGSVDLVTSILCNNAITTCGIAVVRRGSDSVIVHRGSDHKDMGQNFNNVVYSRGTAGSWTNTDIAVSAASGSIHYRSGGAFPSSQANEVHCVWNRPTTTGQNQGATIRADHSVSTVVGSNSGQYIFGTRHGVSFDDGGTFRVVVCDELSAGINIVYYGEDGSNDIAAPSFNNDITVAVLVDTHLAMAISDTDEVYLLFNRDDDDDLGLTQTTDITSTWTTSEEQDAVTVAALFGASFYTLHGADVIGYIWDSNGTITYDEIEVSAGAATSLLHRRRPLRSLIVR